MGRRAVFFAIHLTVCCQAFAGFTYLQGTYKPIEFSDGNEGPQSIRIVELPAFGNASCPSSLSRIVDPEIREFNGHSTDVNVASATSITLEEDGCNELLPGQRLIIDASQQKCAPEKFDALLHCVRRTSLRPYDATTWTLEVRTHPEAPELKVYDGVYPMGLGGQLHPGSFFSSPHEFRLRLLGCSPDSADGYLKGLFTHPAGGSFQTASMINKVEILNPESRPYHPMYVLATTYVGNFKLVQAALFELHHRDLGDGSDRWRVVSARPFSAGGPITWSSTAPGKDQREREIRISCKNPERFTEPVYTLKFRN